MLLSIIIPVYNAEKYLRECIDSVIRQSYQNFELLLVDDGSTDSSMAICKEYEYMDSRIKAIAMNHGGPYLARKQGVENARGGYITFLDADDFVSEEAYILAKEDMKGSIDIISFGISRYFDKKNIRYDRCLLFDGVYNRNEIEMELFPMMIWNSDRNSFGIDPSLGNKLYKASLLKEYYRVSRDVYFHYGEDVAVIYPLIMKARSISFHQNIYYYHRQRQNGAVSPYIKDDLYLDNLYALYKYLSESMRSNRVFQKQIDLFYIYSVELVRQKYGIVIHPENIIFPFDRVEKGEKVIIYGAGNIGRLYIKQLERLHYCNVVLLVDKNHAKLNNEVYDPKKIMEFEYDKVIIAIADWSVRKEVTEFLVELGVERKNII